MVMHNGAIKLNQFSSYWAAMRSDSAAVVCGDQSLSWARLNEQAGSLANAYKEMGLRPGDRIGCLLENCLDYYAIVIAAWKIGAVFVPLNTRFGDFELQAIVSDSQFKLLVTTDEQLQRVFSNHGHSCEGIGIYQCAEDGTFLSLNEALSRDSKFTCADTSADQLGLIVYTSGTTGHPKGVTFNVKTLVDFSFSVSLYLNVTSHDRMLLLAPMAFGGGILCNLLIAYIFGCTIYIEKEFIPSMALQLIGEEKISLMAGVPILWQYMAADPGFAETDLSSLRYAGCGGAPVSLELLETYKAKGVILRQSYGFTEFGGYVSVLPDAYAFEKLGSCGIPGIGAALRIVDADCHDLPAGEAGEILAKGSQCFDGYFNNPEATAEAFENGWYKTGDMGYFDEDGHLYLVDRKKNMVISGGVNVYPAEVERALATIGAIQTVAVLGVPNEQWGEEVVALVSLSSPINEEQLKEQSRKLLGDFKTPKRFLVTDQAFPLTASGKIARGDKLKAFYDQIAG